MISIILSFLFLFQEPIFEKDKYMVTYEKNGFVVITKDSIFRWNKGNWSKGKLIKNEESLDDLLALTLDEKVYLISRGVGLVYQLKGDSIIRKDRSFNWRSRYNTNFIFKDDKIYSLGGYGLWTIKSNLIFFDNTTSEWMLEDYNEAEKLPFDFTGGTTELKDSLLYYMSPPIKELVNDKDVYRYNFNTKNWITLGERNQDIGLFLSNYRTSLRHPIVYDKNGNVGQFLYSRNEFRKFKNPNTGILKDSRLIVGNPNTRQFIVFIENVDNNELPIIVSETLLLGSEYETFPIYTPPYSDLEFIVGITVFLVLVIVVFIIYRRRNAKLIDKVKSHWGEIEETLNSEELKILKTIIEHHPDCVELPFILDRFSPNLTYESKIKKFRKSLRIIEDKLKSITKYRKGDIILSRRNKEDKRIKELYLND